MASTGDLYNLIRELRYELHQAKQPAYPRRWPLAPPSGFQPAIVSTEIPPADGTGMATVDGKVRFLTHDDTGNAQVAGEETPVLNIFQARIPVDVTCEVGNFDNRWYLIAADCDPQGPELQEAQSTTSSLISDISYTPITPVVNVSRPGIYDFRYNVQLVATIPNNATLGYSLQLWDATNSVELANSGPIGQTRAASGIVTDAGSFFSDLDSLASAIDIQIRARDEGDGTLDSSIGDFLQSFGPL